MADHPEDGTGAWTYTHRRAAEIASTGKSRFAAWLLVRYQAATTEQAAQDVGMEIEIRANSELRALYDAERRTR
jgi:uncharacterized GH25 family protein